MYALHVVLVEGALVAAVSIRDERHGDRVCLGQRVDERVCLVSVHEHTMRNMHLYEVQCMNRKI